MLDVVIDEGIDTVLVLGDQWVECADILHTATLSVPYTTSNRLSTNMPDNQTVLKQIQGSVAAALKSLTASH